MSNKLVIMLHGVGSNGDDLLPIAQFWQKQCPHLDIASPDAPFSFMNSREAFQWFSIQGVTEQNRLQRIEQVRESFDKTIGQIVENAGYEQRLEDVIFCGFSQGTMMALDAVVSGRWKIAGMIGFSGRLVTPVKGAITPPILLMHGLNDTVISAQESQLALAQLQQVDANVQLKTYPNLDHAINEQEVQDGLAFIQSLSSINYGTENKRLNK